MKLYDAYQTLSGRKAFAVYYSGPIWRSGLFWLLTLVFISTLTNVGLVFFRRWPTIDHMRTVLTVALVVAAWFHLVVQHRSVRKALAAGRPPLRELTWTTVALTGIALGILSTSIHALVR